jgi:hypothetical protein
MDTNESYSASRGAALPLVVQLRDQLGNPATGFAGSEALATTIWPGGSRAASATPATTWSSHAAGTVAIAITSAETAALAPGRYQLLTRLAAGGADPIDAYGCAIDVLAFAGATAAPTSYCDYSWLLRFGRSWLRQLQTDDDEAGFAEQLGRARSWIEDLGHAHFRVAAMAMVVGGQAMGPRISGARSTWLQDQFDLDYLMVTDQVREASAKKSLAYICEGQVGVAESAQAYARLARMYHSQADYLGSCLTLSLDTNGDGFPDVNIDCSLTNSLYG